MRVALDAVAENAPPESVVQSAIAALAAVRELRLVLVGEPTRLNQALAAADKKVLERITLHPASQAIAADEDPEEALRFRPDTSVGRSWQLLAERKVEAMLSLAPLRALTAAGMRLRRFLPTVRRPALAAVLVAAGQRTVVLDAGAHDTASPAHLYQYGVMGSVYCRLLDSCETPRVSLLAEGNPSDLREADRLLEAGLPGQTYAGLVRPRQALEGATDVLVCSGAAGRTLVATQQRLAALLHEADLPAVAVQDPKPLLGFSGYVLWLPSLEALEEALALAQRLEAVRFNEELRQQLQHGPLMGAAGEEG